MAEQHAGEARQSLPNEAENSSSGFAELLKEMIAINNNITLMHEDINNLVVVDDAAQLSDETEGNGDDLSGVANPERNEEERAETSSVLSVDAKVEHLLKSTQTSREENATSSRNTLLSSIAEDLTVSEMTGDAVQQDLANIFASLFKERLREEKVQSKLAKYPRPQNIENFVTPRVSPSIWNNITASARSTDVKYQKLQQSMLGAIGAMTYAADQAIKNNCDKRANCNNQITEVSLAPTGSICAGTFSTNIEPTQLAGCLKYFITSWEQLTSDSITLNM